MFSHWPEEVTSGAAGPHHISLRDVLYSLSERDRRVGSTLTATWVSVTCPSGRYYRMGHGTDKHVACIDATVGTYGYIFYKKSFMHR